jgi:hypothetical protein
MLNLLTSQFVTLPAECTNFIIVLPNLPQNQILQVLLESSVWRLGSTELPLYELPSFVNY